MRKVRPPVRPAALLLCAALGLCACQGTNQNFQNPQPRSREAGNLQELPPEQKTASRKAVDGSGGQVEFGRAKLTIPTGAVTGEPVFVELAMPQQPPTDVIPETAVLISPQGYELSKDALLTILYRDADVPQGRTEEEIVVVQNINGVWVDLPNSRVQNHNNAVEVPIRFLGLYALQLPPLDQRNYNAEPLASFEVSADPIPAMFAPVEAEAEPAEGEAPAGDSGAAAAPTDAAESDEVTETVEPPPPGASESVQPQAGRQIFERRIVAAPEDEEGGPAGGQGNEAEAQAPGVVTLGPEEDDSAEESAESVAPAAADRSARDESEPKVTLTKAQQERLDAEEEADDDLTFYFDASASSDPDGRVVQYDWDFDSDGVFDLSTSRGPYAKHRFQRNGSYTVVLKVTDNGRYRRSGFATQVVHVRDLSAEPTQLRANISSYPPTGPVPLTVHFASSIIGGSPPYKYNWRFSDGSQSDLANPFTTYPEVSDHTVSFQITDQRGEKLDGSLFVSACDCPPPAEARGYIALDITPDSDRGVAPLTSRFQLNALRATAPVVYRVKFGDEGPGEAATETTAGAVTHTYGNPGFYIMEVLATDGDLRTSKTFATVHVTPSVEPRDFLLGQPDAGGDPYSFGHGMHIEADYTEASPRTVAFYAQETPHPVDAMSFNWDFGDGTYSTEAKPRKTYAKDGTYEVRLTASDGDQLYRHRIWLPVSGKDPLAAIQSPRVVEGAAPLRLNLDAIATRAASPLSYDWRIGDSRRSDPSTYYEFTRAGEYQVGLTITDKYGDTLTAQPVTVRVHRNTTDYRQPLLVIDRDASGSGNRAVVLDYDAGSPLPLSSTDVEGSLSAVDISPNGEYVALVGDDGLLVKQVSNALPVASYLPAAGQVVATVALDTGAAYASVSSAEGVRTYLVQSGQTPRHIGSGRVLDASRGGGNVLLQRAADSGTLAEAALYKVDLRTGGVGEPRNLGRIYQGRLTVDGAELFFIGEDQRVGIRDVATGATDFINSTGRRRHGLAISGDGDALAFVEENGGKEVIYGRRMHGTDFELASLTDQTGFYSDDFELGNDGRFLLAYGSRNELRRLLRGDETTRIDAEKAPGEGRVQPRPERVGVIRLDLSGNPSGWTIDGVKPRFVTDSSRRFSTAGSL